MRIDINVAGDQQVSRELLRFSERNLDASPAFRSIATLLRRVERDQFVSEGAYASGGWEPLAPSTVAQKRRRGGGQKILRRTGALMNSLTKKSGAHHVEGVSPHELVFGSDVPYTKFHQRGTVKMPRRRPLEVRGSDRTLMVKELQAYLVTGKVRD